jgi:hypothetical protein
MDQERLEPIEQPNPNQPYEQPKAAFVPLRIEERLMACGKLPPTPEGGCFAPGIES